MKIIWWVRYRMLDLFRYDIPRFLKNLYVFRKTLWNHRAYDWCGLYQAMQDALIDMEDCHRNHGHHLNNEKCADRMKVCIELIERLKDDDHLYRYFKYVQTGKGFLDGKFVPMNTEQVNWQSGLKLRANIERHQRELLFDILKKHSKSWWD
jgi:hypothetical protein